VGVDFGADGTVRVNDEAVAQLDGDPRVQTVRPTELPLAGSRWEAMVRALETAARTEAEARLRKSAQAAAARLDAELARRLDRLALDADRVEPEERLLRAADMVEEQQFAGAVRAALGAVRLTLDSACVVLAEPGGRTTRP